MGIVVSVKLPPSDATAFEEAVECLLRSYGAQINKLTAADGHILLRAYKDMPSTVEPAPVKAEDPLPPPPPVETLPSPELPPAEAPTELTVAIPSSDAVAASLPPPVSGEFSIKDFSSDMAIPFSYDAAMEHSSLAVSELSIVAEHAHFKFGGMSFKFPVMEGNRIRVMAAFGDSDLVPVFLKLEDGQDSPRVTFGNDVAEIVNKHFPTTMPAETA